MKNIDYKWFIIIGLGIAVAVILILSLRTIDKSKDKYEAKIALLTDSIHYKEGKLAIYKLDQEKLQEQIFVREQKILDLNKYIKILKKKNDEKADSVYNLDNQHTTTYIAEWLSKRSNTK
jgi:hypothetical protein